MKSSATWFYFFPSFNICHMASKLSLYRESCFVLTILQNCFVPSAGHCLYLNMNTELYLHRFPRVYFLWIWCFERNNDQNCRTTWSCGTNPWHPLKRARLNCRGVWPMQAVKQPVTLESFNNWEALTMELLLFSDELWLIISVALLILL